MQHINAAFASASSALLELMTKREGLPDLLRAFKSYFLLARGDLFTTFLELAEAELERNAADVTVTRLQSLLELGVPPSLDSTPSAADCNAIFLGKDGCANLYCHKLDLKAVHGLQICLRCMHIRKTNRSLGRLEAPLSVEHDSVTILCRGAPVYSGDR